MTDSEKKNLWDVGNELATSFTENGGLPWSPEWAQWVQVEVDAYAAPGREAEVRAALLEGGEDAFCGFLSKRKRRGLLDTPEGQEWRARVAAWEARYAAEYGLKVEEAF
jgi:hypothetical protein